MSLLLKLPCPLSILRNTHVTPHFNFDVSFQVAKVPCMSHVELKEKTRPCRLVEFSGLHPHNVLFPLLPADVQHHKKGVIMC